MKCYLGAAVERDFTGSKGLKHMPTAIVPGIYDESLADGNLWIETEDAYTHGAAAGARRRAAGRHFVRRATCTRRTLVARELAAAGESGVIVTVLCDGADKYLSEHFWDD